MSTTFSVERYLGLVKKTLDVAARAVDMDKEFERIVKSILEMQASVNKLMFFTENFSMISYGVDELKEASAAKQGFIDSVRVWIDFVSEVNEMAKEKKTSIDAYFYSLMHYYSVSDPECLKRDMTRNLLKQKGEETKNAYTFYRNLDYLWGKLDPKKNVFDAFEDRINSIKQYENDFIWLYERLADYRSKNVLFHMLQHWITFEPDDLYWMKELSFGEYCDLDILECGDEEVFVDCGAFDGDSANRFIEVYRRYKKIYCYEASPRNFKKLTEKLDGYENIILEQKAVGDSYSTMTISDEEDGSSLLKGGKEKVAVVPVDEEIKEPITLVKMDIEGAEQSALRGMEGHIINEKPKLVICVYHGNRDIIEIPIMIDNMRSDYKFYLRAHCPSLVNIPLDIALYAV